MIGERGRQELRGRALSFRYAFEGWWFALRTQSPFAARVLYVNMPRAFCAEATSQQHS